MASRLASLMRPSVRLTRWDTFDSSSSMFSPNLLSSALRRSAFSCRRSYSEGKKLISAVAHVLELMSSVKHFEGAYPPICQRSPTDRNVSL